MLVFAFSLLPACTPLGGLLTEDEPAASTPDEGETPTPDPEPEPDPDPNPAPDPDPDPAPTDLAVVLEAGTLVVPEGTEVTFPVRLSALPAETVTVSIELVENDGSLTYTGPATLTFTPENWDQVQNVSISANQDANSVDGLAVARITLTGADPVTVSIVASDDEAPQGDGIRLTVKDAAGYGSTDHPITVVVPLTVGEFQSTNKFRITNADGASVPAQFKILSRWWARDSSLRFVSAEFTATVPANGDATYFFKADGGANPAPASPVTVTETDDLVTVDTGKVRFTVKKSGFNIFDTVDVDADGNGSYAASERIVESGSSDGAVFTGRLADDIQRGSDRSNLTVTVEETGPMRAVVKIESLGSFHSTTDHRHGFAMRLYAYAGKSFVKADYQLQNGAKNVKFAWPLYFEDVSLNVQPNLGSATVRMSPTAGVVWQGTPGSGKHVFQNTDRTSLVRDSSNNSTLEDGTNTAGKESFGWADVSDSNKGVTVMIRHMALRWPNAVEVEGDNNVAVRLWPKWSSMFLNGDHSSTGLYWLEDMQCSVKETLFYFHGANASNNELEAMAANFTWHPVAAIPAPDYSASGAVPGLGGVVATSFISGADNKVPQITDEKQLNTGHARYRLGWVNYGGDTSRKKANDVGDWPRGGGHFFASGRVQDYYETEAWVYGDIYVRPMWMPGYTHESDFSTVLPSVNPYGGKSWRAFDGHGRPYQAAPYLSGTFTTEWKPRDNEHGWLYHMEDFYFQSGNLWVKDWYEWMGEFRKRTLLREAKDLGSEGDMFEWSWETRGEAHMLAQSIAAYRVTGDPALLDAIKNRLEWTRKYTYFPRHGNFRKNGEASFQMGFIARVFTGIYTELRDHHPEHEARSFQFLHGIMDWQLNSGRFGYYVGQGDVNNKSSGSGLSLVDPEIYWYQITGQSAHLDLVEDFLDGGVGTGKPPYGNNWGGDAWDGSFETRAHKWHLQEGTNNHPQPATVNNLTASIVGGKVRASFTAPANAERVLLVWSTKPIARTYNDSESVSQFWSSNSVGIFPVAAGASKTVDFEVSASGTIHVALVTLTEKRMSEVSNVATVSAP